MESCTIENHPGERQLLSVLEAVSCTESESLSLCGDPEAVAQCHKYTEGFSCTCAIGFTQVADGSCVFDGAEPQNHGRKLLALTTCSETNRTTRCGPFTATCTEDGPELHCTCQSDSVPYYSSLPAGAVLDPLTERPDQATLPCGAKVVDCAVIGAFETAYAVGEYAQDCTIRYMSGGECEEGTYWPDTCTVRPYSTRMAPNTWTCQPGAWPAYRLEYPTWHASYVKPCGYPSSRRALINGATQYDSVHNEANFFCGSFGTGTIEMNYTDGHPIDGTQECTCATHWFAGPNRKCEQYISCEYDNIFLNCGVVGEVSFCGHNTFNDTYLCECPTGVKTFYPGGVVPVGGNTDFHFTLPCGARTLDASLFPSEYRLAFCGNHSSVCTLTFVREASCELGKVYPAAGCSTPPGLDYTRVETYACEVGYGYPVFDYTLAVGHPRRRAPCGATSPYQAVTTQEDLTLVCGAGVASGFVELDSTTGLLNGNGTCVCQIGWGPGNGSIHCGLRLTACNSTQSAIQCGPSEGVSSCFYNQELNTYTCACNSGATRFFPPASEIPYGANISDARFLLPCGASVRDCSLMPTNLVTTVMGPYTALPCKLVFIKNASCPIGQTNPTCTLSFPVEYARPGEVVCASGIGFPIADDRYPAWDYRYTRPCAARAVVNLNSTQLLQLCGPGAIAGQGNVSPFDGTISLFPDSCECAAGIYPGDEFRCELGYISRPCTDLEYQDFCDPDRSNCRARCYAIPGGGGDVICQGYEDRSCMHTVYSGAITNSVERARVCGTYVQSAVAEQCQNRSNALDFYNCDIATTVCTCSADAVPVNGPRPCAFNYANVTCAGEDDVLQFCGHRGVSCTKRCLANGQCTTVNQCTCAAGFSGIFGGTYCATETVVDVCDVGTHVPLQETFPCGVFGVRRVSTCPVAISDPNQAAHEDCANLCLCKPGTGPMPGDINQDNCNGRDRPCYEEDLAAFCNNAVSCTRRCRYERGQVGTTDCRFLPGSCISNGTTPAGPSARQQAETTVLAQASITDPCQLYGVVQFKDLDQVGNPLTCAYPYIEMACNSTQEATCDTSVARNPTTHQKRCIFTRYVTTSLGWTETYAVRSSSIAQIQAGIASAGGFGKFTYGVRCTCNHPYSNARPLYDIESERGRPQQFYNSILGRYLVPDITSNGMSYLSTINNDGVPFNALPLAFVQGCGLPYAYSVPGEHYTELQKTYLPLVYVDRSIYSATTGALCNGHARSTLDSSAVGGGGVLSTVSITPGGNSPGTYNAVFFDGSVRRINGFAPILVSSCPTCTATWTGDSCETQLCCSGSACCAPGANCPGLCATGSACPQSGACDQSIQIANEALFCVHGHVDWTTRLCVCDAPWTRDSVTGTCINSPCHPSPNGDASVLCGGITHGTCYTSGGSSACLCTIDFTGPYCSTVASYDVLHPLNTARSRVLSYQVTPWICDSTTEGHWSGPTCEEFVWNTEDATKQCSSGQALYIDVPTRGYWNSSILVKHTHGEISCSCDGETTGSYCTDSTCPMNADTGLPCSGHSTCQAGSCRSLIQSGTELQCGSTSQYAGCSCQFDRVAACVYPNTTNGQSTGFCYDAGVCTEDFTFTEFGYKCACANGRNGTFCEESRCPRPTDRSRSKCNFGINGFGNDPNGLCVCTGDSCGCVCGNPATYSKVYVGEACEIDASTQCGGMIGLGSSQVYAECSNGGKCTKQTNGTYACVCDAGHTGTKCETSACGTCPGHSYCSQFTLCECYTHWGPIAHCTGGACVYSGPSTMCNTSVGCTGATVPPPDTKFNLPCACANTTLQEPACTTPKCPVEVIGSTSYTCGRVHPYLLSITSDQSGRRNQCGSTTGTCICENTSVYNSTTGLCVPRCDPVHSPTMYLPVSNGGSFISLSTTCQCSPGYVSSDGCAEPICKHNGTYIVSNSSCSCTPGWTGATCNEPFCTHGTYNVGQGRCQCYHPYNGTRCQQNDCVHGTPVTEPSTTPDDRCQCDAPYLGVYCEVDPCRPYGSVNASSTLCVCDPFHHGSTCQFDSCKNGGVYGSQGSTTCFCDNQYYGMLCDYRKCGPGYLNESTCICPRAIGTDDSGNCTTNRCGPLGVPLEDLTDCLCNGTLVGLDLSGPGTNHTYACEPICQNNGTVNGLTGACQCAENTSGANCEHLFPAPVYSSTSVESSTGVASSTGAAASSTGTRSSSSSASSSSTAAHHSSSSTGTHHSSSSSSGAHHTASSSTGLSTASASSAAPSLALVVLLAMCM